jgi:prepilin-type N-terminal cleavage/methylation domain-containing protein
MRGATLLELLCVLAILGIVTAVAIPPTSRALDRAAVRGAADRYAITFEAARSLAVSRARFSRVEVDTVRVEVRVLLADTASGWDILRTWQLGDVAIRTSQPVVAFSPLGMGWGLSNTRLVFERAAAAETLTVSRTGRMKRS